MNSITLCLLCYTANNIYSMYVTNSVSEMNKKNKNSKKNLHFVRIIHAYTFACIKGLMLFDFFFSSSLWLLIWYRILENKTTL